MFRCAFSIASAALVALAVASPRQGHGVELRLGGRPLELVAAEDSLWLLTCDRGCSGEARHSIGRIARVDPRSVHVTESVTVRRPQALAVDAAGVYGLDFWRGYVYRLDRVSLRTGGQLRLVLPFEIVPGNNDFLPVYVTAGEGAVWVSSDRVVVAKVDSRATRLLATVRLPPKAPGKLAAGDGGGWVAADLAGVYRIDPTSSRVTTRTRISRMGRSLAVNEVMIADGEVLAVGGWAAGMVPTNTNALARIDPRSGRLEGVTPLPAGGPLAVTVGAGSLRVAHTGGSTVERIGPHTGKVVKRYRGRVGVSLAIADGQLWTVTRDGTLRRLRNSVLFACPCSPRYFLAYAYLSLPSAISSRDMVK